MRESRALYRLQNNNDDINIINDSTNVIGGDEGTNSPVEGVATAGAGVAVDHHQTADTAAITSYSGGFGGDYEANEAAFEAEMHAARAEDGISDSSIMATKKKHVKGSSSINFFSPIAKKTHLGGSPHPHVTPSPTNLSMPSNNKKKRKSKKTQHLPSKQQLKSPPELDTQKKSSYPTAPPDGKMLYNRLIDTDRGVLSLTDGKSANTHTLPPPTRYTFSDIIRIDSEAKASVQHHSGGSTVLVQNDSGTRELIQATLAGAHLFYDEKTDEPPCSICGKSPAKTCRRIPDIPNANGPNGRHQFTLTHCYECSLGDNLEGGLFFAKPLCVNRDGERFMANGTLRSKCSKCLSEEPCNVEGCKKGGNGNTNPRSGFCNGHTIQLQRERRIRNKDVKNCRRCGQGFAGYLVQHGATGAAKDTCGRSECKSKCVWVDVDPDGKEEFCSKERVGSGELAIGCYCRDHFKQAIEIKNAKSKQKAGSGQTDQWTDEETNCLMRVVNKPQYSKMTKKGKQLVWVDVEKAVRDEFAANDIDRNKFTLVQMKGRKLTLDAKGKAKSTDTAGTVVNNSPWYKCRQCIQNKGEENTRPQQGSGKHQMRCSLRRGGCGQKGLLSTRWIEVPPPEEN